MLEGFDGPAFEQIRALMATYCISVDRRRWARLRTIFTRDAALQLDGRTVATSADEIVSYIAGAIEPGATSHHATGMVVEHATPEHARVVWSMIYAGAATGLNFGMYDCDLSRDDSSWRIRRLNRVRALSA